MTKLLNVLWTRELQRRLSEDDKTSILCITLDPGSVFTEGSYTAAARFPAFMRSTLIGLAKLAMRSVSQGAGTPVIAATTPEARKNVALYKGAYLEPIGKMGKASKSASDAALAKELWTCTENILSEMNL